MHLQELYRKAYNYWWDNYHVELSMETFMLHVDALVKKGLIRRNKHMIYLGGGKKCREHLKSPMLSSPVQ